MDQVFNKFINKTWFHQLKIMVGVLLVKVEVKELVLHLPGNGGLHCPQNWCLVILAPPRAYNLLTTNTLQSFKYIFVIFKQVLDLLQLFFFFAGRLISFIPKRYRAFIQSRAVLSKSDKCEVFGFCFTPFNTQGTNYKHS